VPRDGSPGGERSLRYGELDREHVVRVALALAERVGVQQLTMRALAQELGLSHTATYYHVPNKQEILDLVADRVLQRITIPDAGEGTWEDRLRALYSSGHQELLKVPGIAQAVQNRPLTDTGRRLGEAAAGILLESGLDEQEAARAHALLFTYLLGAVGFAHVLGPRPGRGPARPPLDDPAAAFAFGLDVILAGLRSRVA
jgi:TetR/AcrR family transcriptional regulator, tetracycline repressor protein